MSFVRATGPSPYHRLDLTGVRLPPAVLVGAHGRAAMLDAAREAGYPLRTITSALMRFSRVYVIQLGGNPDTGTVILGTADRREVTVRLPVDVRYRILPPTRVEQMLAAVQRDYPPGSVTGALAEAVAAVLHVCDRQHALGQSAIPVRTVIEALAPPLNAFLTPWAGDDSGDQPGDALDGEARAAAAAPATRGTEARMIRPPSAALSRSVW